MSYFNIYFLFTANTVLKFLIDLNKNKKDSIYWEYFIYVRIHAFNDAKVNRYYRMS